HPRSLCRVRSARPARQRAVAPDQEHLRGGLQPDRAVIAQPPRSAGIRPRADEHDPRAGTRARLCPPGRRPPPEQPARRAGRLVRSLSRRWRPAGDGARRRPDDLPRSATPLALVFHELATNSAKYGALSAVEGTVDLQVADEGQSLRLCWTERGGPPPSSGAQDGFGSRLVEMSVTGQLGGSWSRRFEPGGLVCELIFARSTLAP